MLFVVAGNLSTLTPNSPMEPGALPLAEEPLMEQPMDSRGSGFLPWTSSPHVRGEAAAAAEKSCFPGPIREGMRSTGKGIW